MIPGSSERGSDISPQRAFLIFIFVFMSEFWCGVEISDGSGQRPLPTEKRGIPDDL